MKNVCWTVLGFSFLTACQAAPAPETAQAPDARVAITEAAPELPATLPSPLPQSFQLVTRKLTAVRAPVNGWVTKTYTSTGTCVVYQANTYCWDDGLKILDWTSSNFEYGPYRYSYWNMSLSFDGTAWDHTSGSLENDLMADPLLITANIDRNILGASVSQVLSTGTPTTVDCVDADGKLSCTGFTVNLNQVHL